MEKKTKNHCKTCVNYKTTHCRGFLVTAGTDELAELLAAATTATTFFT